MLSNIDHVLAQLEGVKEIGADQWISRCPAHHDKTPSLSIAIGSEGQVLLYCFAGCDLDDIVASLGMDVSGLWPDHGKDANPEERRQQTIESRLAAVERKQADHARRLSNLEVMHKSTDHIRYFHNLNTNGDAIEYWCNEGMELQTIDDYMLGYCPRCPTDRKGRASYTIPVLIGGKLYNIRHRLIGADNGDKYRPQMAGLPSVLFNADFLYQDSHRLLVVEGEKKSIICAQVGFPNVGIMGKTGFNKAWRVKFERFPLVYVALDPDAMAQATEIAGLFEGRGRVVILPDKLDDMVVKYGATRNDIEAFLAQGKKV